MDIKYYLNTPPVRYYLASKVFVLTQLGYILGSGTTSDSFSER